MGAYTVCIDTFLGALPVRRLDSCRQGLVRVISLARWSCLARFHRPTLLNATPASKACRPFVYDDRRSPTDTSFRPRQIACFTLMVIIGLAQRRPQTMTGSKPMLTYEMCGGRSRRGAYNNKPSIGDVGSAPARAPRPQHRPRMAAP